MVNPSPLGDGLDCKEKLFSHNYPGCAKLNTFSLREKARMRGHESGRGAYELIPGPSLRSPQASA